MDSFLESRLNKQPTFNYKSFGSSRISEVSSPDPSQFSKDIPLKQVVSGFDSVCDRDPSKDKETEQDPAKDRIHVCAFTALITFSAVVTVALILQIYLGGSLDFIKGALVSDDDRCTELGQRVLRDHGSSVDAAIAATLCLGVVHPHASGIGGGGIMFVHDVRQNKTKVINFQGAAPKKMGTQDLEDKILKEPGLQVGVPGLLRGLQQAHRMYGSLTWEELVSGAASIAKEGFNISESLAEAISNLKGQQLPLQFRALFLPSGRPLRPGSFLRMPSLAAALEMDPSSLYTGNLSREMEEEVRANGGLLSREDIGNYHADIEQPMEDRYNDFIIKVPRPPSLGEALISALKLANYFSVREKNYKENQTQHWTAEALKAVMVLTRGLDNPEYNSSVAELMSDILRMAPTSARGESVIIPMDLHLRTGPPSPQNRMAGRVAVMGPDGLMVCVASSLSRPFGSRLMTRSGIILNSLVLDFHINQNAHTERRPALMSIPALVVPAWHKCGLYMAICGSNAHSLSLITQVLLNVLTYNSKENDEDHWNNHQPNNLFDDHFPEDGLQIFHGNSSFGKKVKANEVIVGILRTKDDIRTINAPQIQL